MDLSMPASSNQYPNFFFSNPLYKTEFCRNIDEVGECRYYDKCQFAHYLAELRPKITHHPHYRTKLCRMFHGDGYCPFGIRCVFIHKENVNDWKSNNRVIYVSPKQSGYYTAKRKGAGRSETTSSSSAQLVSSSEAKQAFRRNQTGIDWKPTQSGYQGNAKQQGGNQATNSNYYGRKRWSKRNDKTSEFKQLQYTKKEKYRKTISIGNKEVFSENYTCTTQNFENPNEDKSGDRRMTHSYDTSYKKQNVEFENRRFDDVENTDYAWGSSNINNDVEEVRKKLMIWNQNPQYGEKEQEVDTSAAAGSSQECENDWISTFLEKYAETMLKMNSWTVDTSAQYGEEEQEVDTSEAAGSSQEYEHDWMSTFLEKYAETMLKMNSWTVDTSDEPFVTLETTQPKPDEHEVTDDVTKRSAQNVTDGVCKIDGQYSPESTADDQTYDRIKYLLFNANSQVSLDDLDYSRNPPRQVSNNEISEADDENTDSTTNINLDQECKETCGPITRPSCIWCNGSPYCMAYDRIMHSDHTSM